MLADLLMYLEYPFVRYAIIVGVLIALSSSLLGVTLVLKHYSFIGDSLSHVAFGAMAVAGILKMANLTVIVLPVTVFFALIIIRDGGRIRIKGDAALAMISVGALAFGYMAMNLFSTSANLAADVCGVLFGATSILTLGRLDVWLSIGLSIIVVAYYIFFYNRIFGITFDEKFADATGTNVKAYQSAFAVITALVIVISMNLVGSLLISALIIFPALSSMQLFGSFRKVTVCSAIFSVCGALAGMLIAILAGTPVGSTIVMADVVIYFVCLIAGKIARR
ncbi:MAG: metal ABC transporter permease [Lachnospiraceae bacterium]|jgi:zinc transport system permease protein